MMTSAHETPEQRIVTVENGKVRVGDERFPLISGEVHYWRLDPANWRVILERTREMGLSIVATYVCWDYHELEPGRFDFHGKTDPRRDLVGFLELASEQDFWIILRPGPYIYSEWSNNGVPDYAARYHRLDPQFQKLAQPYMEAVTEAVRPHLATRGGRVIMWQADNEIDPWPHWYTEEMGLGSEPGPFQGFVLRRYQSIAALNEAWGTSYLDFEEVHATRVMLPDQPDMMRRYLDFVDFRHWYVNQVAEWAADSYRQLGVDVPLILNTYSGVATQRWADMESATDPERAGTAIVGPDIYPSNEFAHRGNEHRNFMDAVRYTRSYSQLPYIPEFQAGIWHDWLPDVRTLTPNHYRLISLSALLAGAVGWNWYMLVNRDNWYQSPINEWGRTRPDLFAAFKQVVDIYMALDPAELQRLTPTALTYDPHHRSTTRPAQPLLQSFYDAGLDYDFVRPEAPLDAEALSHPLLFYAGDHWASAATQENLKRYVQEGGHLFFVGTFPRFDEHFQPYNALDIPLPDGMLGGGPHRGPVALSLGSERVELHSPYLYNYERVPGDAITAEQLPVRQISSEELVLQGNLQVGARYTIGFSQERGQGRVTVIGAEPVPALIRAVHSFAGVAMSVSTTTPDITATLYQRDNAYYLIAVNNGNEGKAATFFFDPDIIPNTSINPTTIFGNSAHPLRDGGLVLEIPRKDGAVIRITE
jgi:beta-galactosidase